MGVSPLGGTLVKHLNSKQKMIWHYPEVEVKEQGTATLPPRKSNIQYDDNFVQYSLNYSNYLSPSIFIIDFDNTLAFYDEKLELDISDNLPSIYTRPYMFQFLQFLKIVNKTNVIILWTRGTREYINRCLLLLKIANYFDHILSRIECNQSREKYGCFKSFNYIKELYPQYSNMRSFLVDDRAIENGGGPKKSSYYKLICVKPFTIIDIQNTTDTTLFNVMLYLDKSFFTTTTSTSCHYHNVICQEGDKLVIKKRSNLSNCQVFVVGWYPRF